MERINAIDGDGLPIRPGRYRFIEEDREARAEEGADKTPHLNTPIPAVLQLCRCASQAQPGLASCHIAATQAAVSSAEYLRLVCSCPFYGGSGREPRGSPVCASGVRYANLLELPP
ncbi:hypothetical protein GCM10027195_14380 [Comamonas sediminis]